MFSNVSHSCSAPGGAILWHYELCHRGLTGEERAGGGRGCSLKRPREASSHNFELMRSFHGGTSHFMEPLSEPVSPQPTGLTQHAQQCRGSFTLSWHQQRKNSLNVQKIQKFLKAKKSKRSPGVENQIWPMVRLSLHNTGWKLLQTIKKHFKLQKAHESFSFNIIFFQIFLPRKPKAGSNPSPFELVASL